MLLKVEKKGVMIYGTILKNITIFMIFKLVY